jgi:FMN phosphatase YigB (HAD superfamily)
MATPNQKTDQTIERNLTQDRYIFLDIDGVLIKTERPHDRRIAIPILRKFAFDLQCANQFETVIRQYKNAKIVISSSRRKIFPLDTIKARFSKDIAARVAGATSLKIYSVDKYQRYRQVLDYLRQHALEDNSWVAIDDTAEHFPPEAPVIVTNSFEGFDEVAALELEHFLTTAR